MKNIFTFFLCSIILFSSCKKSDPTDNTSSCAKLTAVSVTTSGLSVNKGDKFLFSAAPTFANSSTNIVTYTWVIPGVGTKTSASDSISGIDYVNAGWWYVTAKNTCDGTTKKDSFNLTVNVPLNTPPCINSVTNNVFNFSVFLTEGPATFSNVKQKDSVLNYGSSEVYFGITADQPYDPVTSGFGSIAVAFHPQYKLSNLPPTGTYTTTTLNANSRPVFAAGDVNKCSISYIRYNPTAGTVVYKSDANQNVYIFNENGKLRAVFCGIALNGTSSLNSITYHPVATGALAVQ